MKSWVKLYTEINHDPKIGQLTWAQRGIWQALLALCGEVDDEDENRQATGMIDSIESTAWRIRCDQQEFNAALELFVQLKMVEVKDRLIYLINFNKRNKRAPSNNYERVNERVKRHRDNLKRACNEDVTSLKRGETLSDSDSDSDSDSEKNHAAPQKKIAAQDIQKPLPKRKNSSQKEKSSIPEAVKIYREMTSLFPPKPLFEKIENTVGSETEKLEFWRQIILEWLGHGFKKNNCSGMLQCFIDNKLPGKDWDNGNRRQNANYGLERLRQRDEDYHIANPAEFTGLTAADDSI